MQRLALLAVGNLAFSLENRRTLATSESLREFLIRLTVAPEPRVNRAAARALAILGWLVGFYFSLFFFLINTCLMEQGKDGEEEDSCLFLESRSLK